jgi:hypothetical protein
MGEWRYSSTILDLGTRWRWVASYTPRHYHCIGGWVGPRAGLDVMEKRKSGPSRESNTGCPAHSLSLYRLSYPVSSSCSCSLLIVPFPFSEHRTVLVSTPRSCFWSVAFCFDLEYVYHFVVPSVLYETFCSSTFKYTTVIWFIHILYNIWCYIVTYGVGIKVKR